jgi:hypothetical protein
MSDGYPCWRCGTVIVAESLPIRHSEVCTNCNADLHVCRQCLYYNPRVADACEEPIAARVSDKQRANYCDYFKPSAAAWCGAGDAAGASARSELDQLFGAATDASAESASEQSELERLFGLRKD